METKTMKLYTLADAQTHFAVAYNQQAWALLALPERTPEERQTLIDAAHASALHWAQSPAYLPKNKARALFLLATVYTAERHTEEAQYYAKSCLKYSESIAAQLDDFDLPYAYLAVARALAVAGQRKESMQFFTIARQAGAAIANEEDKNLFLNDFRTKI
jgi:tetratricopeptide (TPR) repeat protein